MKISSISHETRIFNNVSSDIIKEISLNCFLHHKIKLIRNWGSTDNTDQLPFKDVTLLQFTTPSTNFTIILKTKEGKITIEHFTNRGRKLYLYFIKQLQSIINNEYKPNF